VLGACKSCPGLRSELAEKDAKLALFEKASSESTGAKCLKCEALELEVTNCRHETMRVGEENTYLRSILSWVSSSEPQLGMMVSQFKRGTDTTGLGFAIGGKGEVIYGKVGQGSGLSESEKNPIPPKLTKITPPKPTQPLVKDGVFQETPQAPPPKQVWIPKPNHLWNPLDTLPNIPSEPLPRHKSQPRVIHSHKPMYQQPPKRAVRYHCEYCHRKGHLEEFCFRRKRDERRDLEMRNRDMYHAPYDGYVPRDVRRFEPRYEKRFARPRYEPRPRHVEPRMVVPRGGCARRGGRSTHDFAPRGSGIVRHAVSNPSGGNAQKVGSGMTINAFLGRLAQHWFDSKFSNPSVGANVHAFPHY
jgi:hypothetical protein